MATAVSASDAALVAELRQRLKVPRSSDLPQTEHVGLALRLARDSAINTTKNFWPDDIKSSATRTRIRKLAGRMRDEGHLAAAELALAQPVANDTPWYSDSGLLDNQLILQQSWIEEHLQNVSIFGLEPLERSACGLKAIRNIFVELQPTGDVTYCEVQYDLAPAEGESAEDQRRRRMMHRCREEAALRGLDESASVAYRARRAAQRHRLQARDAEVCKVLETTIAAVERSAWREAVRDGGRATLVMFGQTGTGKTWARPLAPQKENARRRLEKARSERH